MLIVSEDGFAYVNNDYTKTKISFILSDFSPTIFLLLYCIFPIAYEKSNQTCHSSTCLPNKGIFHHPQTFTIMEIPKQIINMVILPGEPHGQRSLVGCSSWGRKESGATETLTLSPFLTSFIVIIGLPLWLRW